MIPNKPQPVKRYRGRSADHWNDPVDRANVQRLITARVDRLLAEYGRLHPALVDDAAQMAVEEGPLHDCE